MDFKTYIKASIALLKHPGVFLGQKKYVLLLSHMRAYTTLISHILASNSQINGYTEQHIPYNKHTDLIRLRYKLYNIYDEKLDGKYLLDKLLHNNLTLSDKVISNKNINFIFLTRKPSQTIPSVIKMANRLDLGNLKELEHARNYYVGRINQLRTLSTRLSQRYFYIEGDDFMQNTDHILSELSDFLGLDTPLSQSYDTFKMTGSKGIGDSSEYIQTGKIIKTRESIAGTDNQWLSLDSEYFNNIEVLKDNASNY